MSNDKAEATYHGRPRVYLVGDWVYVTDLPEFDHRLGRVVKIQGSPHPYVVQIELPEHEAAVNRAFDWLALTPVGVKGMAAYRLSYPRETTGEHIRAKLADDPYRPLVEGESLVDRQQEIFDHVVSQHPRRSWTPTPGELGLALGIVVFIIVLFVFFVAFYPGW